MPGNHSTDRRPIIFPPWSSVLVTYCQEERHKRSPDQSPGSHHLILPPVAVVSRPSCSLITDSSKSPSRSPSPSPLAHSVQNTSSPLTRLPPPLSHPGSPSQTVLIQCSSKSLSLSVSPSCDVNLHRKTLVGKAPALLNGSGMRTDCFTRLPLRPCAIARVRGIQRASYASLRLPIRGL